MIGNHLEPFKFWCQKVLPNVYDDSLSYYEYLCKLNEYLNEVIGQINTLTDNMEDYESNLTALWEQTQSWITNYFNTLDVQNEINTKLNNMASSGELSALLAPIVGTQIGGVVAQQIGDTVASQIGATVGSQIDSVVASQINTPVAEATADWLSTHITPTTPTVDESLSISGAAADSKVTGDATIRTFVQSAIYGTMKINKRINGITFLLDNTTGDTSICSTQLIHNNNAISLSCPEGYQYLIAYFSSLTWTTANHIENTTWITGNYTIPANSYFAVQMRRVNSIAFDSENDKFKLTSSEFVTNDTFNTVVDGLEEQIETNPIVKFRNSQTINKSVNGVTFIIGNSTGDNTITTVDILYTDKDITINVPTGYRFIVHYYSTNVWATENHLSSSGWKNEEYIIPRNSYYVVQFNKLEGTFADSDDKYLLDYTIQNVLLHIIVTGQSLGVGAEGNPALTVRTPMEYIGKCYEFNGGARPVDGMENNTGVEMIELLDNTMQNFTSLCEQNHTLTLGHGEDQRHAYQGETICSAMGYWLAKNTKLTYLVSNHSIGGKSYSGLKKGTVPYNNSIRAVRHAKELCERYGWRYKVYAIAVVHGEADMSGGATEYQYKERLKEWINDYNTDIKAITNQTTDVQMFVSQSAASSAYNLEYANVANGVFQAAIEDAKIHMVCPQYCFPITYASVHMNNYGYRVLGEFFGFNMARKYNALVNLIMYPIKSKYSGTTITLTFNDASTLAYDGNNVLSVSDGHWGFELVNAGTVQITNVAITNNKIIINLDNNLPDGAYISYAYKTLPDEMGHIGSRNGVRGNVRNTAGFTSLFTNEYYPQWSAMFSVPVNWTIANDNP